MSLSFLGFSLVVVRNSVGFLALVCGLNTRSDESLTFSGVKVYLIVSSLCKRASKSFSEVIDEVGSFFRSSTLCLDTCRRLPLLPGLLESESVNLEVLLVFTKSAETRCLDIGVLSSLEDASDPDREIPRPGNCLARGLVAMTGELRAV